MARFAAAIGQHISVVVAYAPTEAATDTVKGEFYEELQTVLLNIPKADKVAILGDFNAALGILWTQSQGVLGRQHLPHEREQPSANGCRLLNLSELLGLRIANTWFQHPPKHRWTWQHPTGHTSVGSVHLFHYTIVSILAMCQSCHMEGITP